MTFDQDQSHASLSATVGTGDTRASLAALRDLLARTLDACEVKHRRGCDCDCGPPPPRASDVSALAARLADVLIRLERIPATRKDAVDDLASKRAARRAKATGT